MRCAVNSIPAKAPWKPNNERHQLKNIESISESEPLPREYIYCEEFEQDCRANTVPRRDCFCRMGLFQRLS